MAQADNVGQSTDEAAQSMTLTNMPRPYAWALGIGLVIIVMLASLLMFGSNMEYPTTVSSSQVETTGGNTITIEKSLRKVTGEGIDNWANWLTTNGDWLFKGVEWAIEYALQYIENTLKWIPWPAIVVGMALLSFAVGRWSLMIFISFATLYFGFMGLWENTIDTVALMVVAVVISVAVGLPLGVIAARNQLVDNISRPILDAMQTMPSFVYLLPGILFFGLGSPAGIFATLIYAVPPVIRLTNLGIRQVSGRDRGSRALVRGIAVAGADKSASTDGNAHHHGGRKPNHDDGAGDGNDCQHGRRAAVWATMCCARCKRIR